MMDWRPIESAPRDGQWILACGMAYKELADHGHWFTHNIDDPRVPHQQVIKWKEAWYDEDIDLGNGTFRKEKKLGYAYWGPDPHAFHPTHWMPLPEPPKGEE